MAKAIASLRTKSIVLNRDLLAILLFSVFYASPFFVWACEQATELLGFVGVGQYLYLIVVYGLLGLLICLDQKFFVPDFLLLYFAVIAFFLLTYIIHPEYHYVYTREYYGVFPYVLRPDNGIFAYLFVRMLKEPNKLLSGLRISAWIMLAYSLFRLFLFFRRGYWLGENHLGETVELSYDLNFGYSLMLPVCTFLYVGLKEKKLLDLILAGLGIVMILVGGARGPLLSIIIFCGLFVLMTAFESKHRTRNVLIILLLVVSVYLFYRPILTLVAHVFESLNISSRTITKLLEGSISDDNGRIQIWSKAIELIRNNPLGYGAMGARNGLHMIHYVGHPHNLFLELIIDYGVVLGPLIIIVMLGGSIYLLFSKKTSQWKWIYLLFFAQACTLLTSYTYWHSTGIWGALGAAVCAFASIGKQKRNREVLHG